MSRAKAVFIPPAKLVVVARSSYPKETEESYTVRCSIIQPGQQSLFDNEHTVYETVKVGEADGVLGTSTDEHGKNVYTLSWEHRGITHTVMGNIPYDEIMKIAEGIR